MSCLNLAVLDLSEIVIPVANVSRVVPLRSAVLGPTLLLSGDETNYPLDIM